MDDITINGRTYAVSTEYDDCMGAPWDEHDGHGIVSEWTTRDKRAGELILVQDRNSRRFYDFAATMKKSEGGKLGIERRRPRRTGDKVGAQSDRRRNPASVSNARL